MRKRITPTYKGLPLVDATKDLHIEVIKPDVAHARKNDPNKCAAALSIQRIMKAEAEVHISRTYIKDEKSKVWIRFVTPASISREIISFDRAGGFEPGKYILKAPNNSMKLGRIHSHGSNHDKTGKGRRPHHTTVNIRERAK